MSDQNTVTEGSHVIFKSEENTRVFQIYKHRAIFFKRNKVKGTDIVGQKYGTLFELDHGRLTVVKDNIGSSPSLPESGKDNRDLVASTENQKLSQDDIMKMKEEGLSGKDIIGKLVEQSETFKTKTEFSQEKYIKKKKKKHIVEFRILPPNSCLLLDTYKDAPGKICNLRADSLSQMLSFSNVMAGSTVGVVESCQGFVLGSIMERMGGNGRVIHLYPGNDMNRHTVRSFNFSEDHMQMLLEFPLNKLAALENGTLLSSMDSPRTQGGGNSVSASKDTTVSQGDSEGSGDVVKVSSSEADRTSKDVEMGDAGGEGDGCGEDMDHSEGDGLEQADGSTASQPAEKKRPRRGGSDANREQQNAKRQHRMEKVKEAASVLQKHSLDSLIIATKFDPVSLLMRLLPYVAPSRPVVVFSQHKEPLVECFQKVRENGSGVQLRLAESWYREYQVLPSRTHPLMSMSGTGGYLLSFIRVTS